MTSTDRAFNKMSYALCFFLLAATCLLLLSTPASAQINQHMEYVGPNKEKVDTGINLVLRWAINEIASEDVNYCSRRAPGRKTKKAICPAGYNKYMGKCIEDKCPPGFANEGGKKCRAKCPAGFRDDGLYCKKKEKTYGRGAGSGKKKCVRKHGKCEKNGLLWYPKCREGYKNFGCCVCRTTAPDCESFIVDGMRLFKDSKTTEKTVLSCAKETFQPDIKEPICPEGFKRGTKLSVCYSKCPPNYKIDGLLCRQTCPPNQPVKCGAAYCAKSKGECASSVWEQTLSVVEFGLNAATLGRYSSVKNLQKVAGKAVAAKNYVDKVSEGWSAVKMSYDVAANMMTTEFDYPPRVPETIIAELGKEKGDYVMRRLNVLLFSLGHEKYPGQSKKKTREALLVGASFEPTGVMEMVRQFWKPKCDRNPFPPSFTTLPLKEASVERVRIWWIPTSASELIELPLKNFPSRFDYNGDVAVAFPSNMAFPTGAQGRICRVFDNNIVRIGTQFEGSGNCITARHEKTTTESYPIFDLLAVDQSGDLVEKKPEEVPKMWENFATICRAELDNIDFEEGVNGQVGIGYVHGGKCWVPSFISDRAEGRVIGVDPGNYKILLPRSPAPSP